jgi:hypothetical protein
MKAFTETNAAKFTSPAHLGASIFFFTVGLVSLFSTQYPARDLQEQLTQVLGVVFLALGGISIYYSKSLRVQIRSGLLEYRDAFRQTHYCRLEDIKHVTGRKNVGPGRRREFLEIHYREGGIDYHLEVPSVFARKFLTDLQSLAPPEPPPKYEHDKFFRPIRGGDYQAEFGSYLPGLLLLIPILIAGMFNLWYLLLAALLLPFFFALGAYRLIVRGEQIIFRTFRQEHVISQREITDCTAYEPERDYPFLYAILSVLTGTIVTSPMHYEIVVNGRDIISIPDKIFPNQCYVELLTFNKSRGWIIYQA